MDHTLRNWHGYYEPPHRGHSGLNLSSPTERDTKPLFNNQHGGGVGRNHHQVMVNNNGNAAVYHPHRVDMGIPDPQMHNSIPQMDFWLNQKYNTDVKVNMNVNVNVNHLSHLNSYGGLSEASGSHGLQIIPAQPEALKEERMVLLEEPQINGNGPLKKRPGGRAQKSPKPKKPKRVVPKDEDGIPTQRASRPARKSMGVNINGIDLDLSGIPIPVCSCTGAPQQCYRWGCGGWQSACCTTSISMYPLPMSNKRRGARIAGRKMSQGAFKKVLEKLATEGYNLSNPIDLRTHWAKHGTNKFVTIR